MRTRTLLLFTVVGAALALAGCVTPANEAGTQSADIPGEDAATDDSWARALPDTIEGLEAVTTADSVENGRGIVAHGDHVYASGGQGFHVLDVSDPDDPQVVGELPELGSRDVDLIHYGANGTVEADADGINRTVAVLATQSNGMKFVDVTDPEDPELLASILEGVPVHNLASVPGTPYVYNSRSLDVGAEGVDVVDASNPDDPEVMGFRENVLTCHDVDFRMESDRAYCAGVEATEIWNVEDPAEPTVVSRIVNPAISIHHWATPVKGGDVLVIGDEFAGAAAYGCGARTSTPTDSAGDASDPVGAVWFYDISNEEAPTPLSWLSVDAPTGNWDNDPGTACTAHFGEVVPDRDKMVVGWYIAGTYVVDFSDATAPKVVDRWSQESNVWDARVHNGYVFTGDQSRGVDILGFTGAS